MRVEKGVSGLVYIFKGREDGALVYDPDTGTFDWYDFQDFPDESHEREKISSQSFLNQISLDIQGVIERSEHSLDAYHTLKELGYA